MSRLISNYPLVLEKDRHMFTELSKCLVHCQAHDSNVTNHDKICSIYVDDQCVVRLFKETSRPTAISERISFESRGRSRTSPEHSLS